MSTVMDRLLARQPLNSSPGQLENPQYPISGTGILEALRIPLRASAGVIVTEKTALGMPAVWRSVNLIASGAASLPLHAYRQVDANTDGQVVPAIVTTGNAAGLLRNPHPDMTPFELWEIVFAHMLLWGNAYLQKLRDQTGVVRELWPLHPSRVTPGRASDMSKVYEIDGGQEPRTDREILHIPGFGYDGIAGISPIGAARQGIGLALAAEQFGGQLFGNGSLAGGVLTTDTRLTPEKADSLKARWKAKMAGLDNAHEVAVLDQGTKFQSMTIPPDDAQFIQSRAFQVEEIARIYGVPPHMLMAVDKTTSWGSGIEEQSLAFVTYTLRPWLTRVEQRLTTLLRPQPVYAKYNLQGLLRGDSQQRALYYTQMRNIGVLNANEIRAYEDLPPIDGGDKYLTPLNMADPNAPVEEPTNA